MTRRAVGIVIVILVGLLGVGAGYIYWQQLRGIWPAVSSPSINIASLLPRSNQTPAAVAPGDNQTDLPLTVAPGFAISLYADDLPGVRAMARDTFGNWWVSQPSQGTVTQLEVRDGQVAAAHPVFRNLRRPHGLAIDPQQGTMLYIAEEHRVSRVPLYSDGSIEKIADLPADGGHNTRTLGFGPDGRLYVSIGSSCNVCNERDSRRAKIYAMNPDGSNFQEVAHGLRNAVFFTWSPVDGRMWATEMGRDLLGDNIPPDEINIINAGGDYGWPQCYGNKVHDRQFDDSAAAAERCAASVPPVVEIPAHSAPLGIAFVPEEGWPEEYWHNLLVAYHGSWNRSEPTGYKVVRVKLDERGQVQGTEDFITGWLKGEEALGRPVALYTEPGGVAYLTDDKAGVIYRITATHER